MGICVSAPQSDAAQNNVPQNYLYKVVLVGPHAVGKSSLIIRHVDNTFVEEQVGSIGSDFKVSFLEIERSRIKMQIWDTAGVEKFRVMTSSYFSGASAVIAVFDVGSSDSFAAVAKWLNEAKTFTEQQKNISFFIIGNKSDLSTRQVSRDDAEKFALANSAIYFEVSAKTGALVNEAFNAIAKTCFEKQSTLSL